MRFDDVLLYLGDCGPYQKRAYFLLCLPLVFAAIHKLAWVFIGATPNHRCRLSANDSFVASLQNHTIPWDDSKSRWSQCQFYNYLNYSTDVSNNATSDAFTSIKACDSWVYDQSQYHSTVVTEFDQVCHMKWVQALTYALFVVGEFIGSIFVSSLSDRFGRRKVIIFSFVGEGIAGVLAGLIHNYYAFVVLRLLIGAFSQAIVLTVYTLAMEFVRPSQRVYAGTLCNYFFGLGYVIIAGVAYAVRDWYYLQIALSVPILIFCIFVRWIPESARWLMSVNRREEAMDIIKTVAKVNKIILPPEVLLDEKEHILPKVGPLDLIRSQASRNIIFLMGYIWFVNSAVYYGLGLNTSNLGGNDYLNFLILALTEIPAYTLCLWALNRYGRRLPTFLSMVVGGAGLGAIIFVPEGFTEVTVGLATVGKFGITTSYAIVFVFGAELVPTQVRNAAMGVFSTCARLGSMITPFILLLTAYWRPLPLIVLGAMSVSAGLLVLFLPETKGKTLPETMTDVRQLKTGTNADDGTTKRNLIALSTTVSNSHETET